MARILIADDSADVRRLVVATLADGGHHVMQVPDGQQALDALTTESFEVAVLDVMMPGLDGLTLCRMLRDAQGLGHLAVVIMSGTSSEMAALAAGADAFLDKPFLPSTLLKVVISLTEPTRGSTEHHSHLPREGVGEGDGCPAVHPIAHQHVSLDGIR